MKHISALLLAVGLSMTLSYGQGNTCTAPKIISGIGPFAIDLSGLTPSGFTGGLCFANQPGPRDGFYQWTATTAGSVRFSLPLAFQQGAHLDVHLGSGCAAVCLDRATTGPPPSTPASVEIPGVIPGQTFLIQIHEGFGIGANAGDLRVQYYVDPCANQPDDFLEDNDTCAQAPEIRDGSYDDLYVSLLDKDLFSLCIPAGGTLTVGTVVEVTPILWDPSALDCGVGPPTNALAAGAPQSGQLLYTNPTTQPIPVILEMRSTCAVYSFLIRGTDVCAGADPILTYCNPMDPNSTGQSTTLTGAFTSPTGTGMHLESTQGPPSQFGYFIVGTLVRMPGHFLGNGRLCHNKFPPGWVGRYNITGTPMNSLGRFDASGVFQNIPGTSTTGQGFDVPATLPRIGSPTIQAGETWNFQLWHREPNGQSNASNALSVRF